MTDHPEDPTIRDRILVHHGDQPAVKRTPYVYDQLNRLDQLAKRLDEAVTELAGKIAPVLRIDMPDLTAAMSEKVTEAPPQVPLAEQISQIAHALDSTLLHVESLEGRVEV